MGKARTIGGYSLIYLAFTLEPGSLAHEIGHCFGLYHTFETMYGKENIVREDINGCIANHKTAGDFISDTQAAYNGSSNTLHYDNCGNSNYNMDVYNLMSYFSTRNSFTSQQIFRMHRVIEFRLPEIVQNIDYSMNLKVSGSTVGGVMN